MMLNLSAAITSIFLSGKKVLSYILTILSILITALIVVSDIDLKALQYLYPGQEIVHFEDTPYSKIVVTRTDHQYNFYENGTFLFSENNTIMSEENVHYAMAQHAEPDNVLLISGGISGSINEILKYKIKSLDYIEQNPKIIEIGELYTNNISADPRVKIIYQDARHFLKANHKKKYDVVLINLPDPSSAQINRFYTLEFFEELKKDLDESAVICISLTATSNYMGEQSRKINSSVFLTLKLLFQNVIIMPGGFNYFIASDGTLSRSINELLEVKNIKNTYLNPYYLNDKKIEQESKLLEEMLSEKVSINYDFKPVVYLYQLDYWLSQFDLNYLILFVIMLFPITYSLLKMNFINYGIFVTGISASAIEVILIIAFQVIYGYTYQMMGILITFFMAGLFVGSIFIIKKIKVFVRTYSLVQYLIGIYSMLVALSLYILRAAPVSGIFVHIAFILLIFIIGILTGLQFSLASRLRTMPILKIAASTYASDLLGAAVGAVLVAAFLIPYFGIIKVSLIIAILNFITGLYILLKLKNS
jgi:spermidine synthase